MRFGLERAAGNPHRPPGPKGRPLIGNLFRLAADPFGFVTEAALEHGDIILLVNRPVKVYLINHPEYIRDVLVTHNKDFVLGPIRRSMKSALGDGLLTSEGDLHRDQRRLIQPAFHKKRIAAYGSTMVEQTSRHTASWRDEDVVDASREMMELTLQVVIQALFNCEVPATVQHLGDATTAMNRYMSARGRNPLGPMFEKLPLPSNRRFRRAKALVDGIIYDFIRGREESGTDNGDLLSMLIAAGSMSRRQMRDEAITIIAAGHETIANTLTWTWYLLSEHPKVETKLHQELDLELNGRPPTVDDLPRLSYAEQVLTEAIRLYPPSWATLRKAVGNVQIGDYVIPKGAYVLVSQYVTHRDERWFPDALSFKPERWTSEFRASVPKGSYFPFGAGPRQCIGESFAWMEGVLLLASIAQHWQLKVLADHPVELDTLITLRPKNGMPMVLNRRTASSTGRDT